MEGRLSLRIAAVAAVGLACAGAPPGGGTERAAPAFSPSRLANERVAVLSPGEIDLPDSLPATIDEDSLEEALLGYAGDALAAALSRTGAAGRITPPAELAPELEAAGPALLERVRDALSLARDRGTLDRAAERDLETLRRRTGTRFLLVPRSLRLAIADPLVAEAALTVDLVDAGAGRVAWSADVAGTNDLPPAGGAEDLFAAALRKAVGAAAERAVSRLTASGEPEDFESTTP
ncbi:MAG: hypothetical protein R3199_05890 [Gemmatimonadota bacterium]|nr:hypothetical protein [Gemmatimonadota bacterium]